MKELALQHHIYSSLGGYKTLFASKRLPDTLVKRLDRYSTETYDKIPQNCPREIFFTDEGFIILSKKFVNGSDHVGRTRSCVHNVVIHLKDLQHLNFFNPFMIPDSVFIPDDANLQHLQKYIQRAYLVEDGEFVDIIREISEMNAPQDLLRNLMAGLLSGKSTCIIRGASRKTINLLEKIVVFLPPALRNHISLIAFFPLKQYIVSLKNNVAVVLLSKDDDIERLIAENFAVIDLVDKKTYNYPTQNEYVEFVMNAISGDGQMAEVVKLLKVLEKYRIKTVLTPEYYEMFIKAYRNISDSFTPGGNIDVSSNPSECIDSVLGFYRTGYWNIALDIIEKCFQQIIQNRYFCSFDEKKADQLGLFVKFLKETFSRPEREDTTVAFVENDAKAAMELLQNKLKLSEDIADFEI